MFIVLFGRRVARTGSAQLSIGPSVTLKHDELPKQNDAHYERKWDGLHGFKNKEHNGGPLGNKGGFLPNVCLISIRLLRSRHDLYGRQRGRYQGEGKHEWRDEVVYIVAVDPLHYFC